MIRRISSVGRGRSRNERFPAPLACGSLREHGAGEREELAVGTELLELVPGEVDDGATSGACTRHTKSRRRDGVSGWSRREMDRWRARGQAGGS